MKLSTKTPAEILKLVGHVDDLDELASFLNEHYDVGEDFKFSAGILGIIRLTIDTPGVPIISESIMVLNKYLYPTYQSLEYIFTFMDKTGLTESTPLGEAVEIAAVILYEKAISRLTRAGISEVAKTHFSKMSKRFEGLNIGMLHTGHFDILKNIDYNILLDIKKYIRTIEHELPVRFIEALDHYIKINN